MVQEPCPGLVVQKYQPKVDYFNSQLFFVYQPDAVWFKAGVQDSKFLWV